MNEEVARTAYTEATALFNQGSFSEALARLDALTRAFPSDKELLHSQALCLAGLGRWEEAKALCDKLEIVFGDARGTRLKSQLESGGPAGLGQEAVSETVTPTPPPVRSGRPFPVFTVLLAVAILAAAGAAVYFFVFGDPGPVKLTAADFQYTVGSAGTFRYDDAFDVTYEFSQRFEKDGNEFLVVRYRSPDGRNFATFCLSVRSDGLYIYRGENDENQIGFLKFPLYEGMEWDSDIASQRKVEQVSLTVPAGTFECIHVVTTGLDGLENHAWYARGIGYVKFEMVEGPDEVPGTMHMLELIALHSD